MKKILVIGVGEVGTAIKTIEEKKGNEVDVYDLKEGQRVADWTEGKRYDIMHICFPHSNEFEYMVETYLKWFKADLCIINSSVPVGTCERIDSKTKIVHSPVRGVHPDLVKGILTFMKYVGGPETACKRAISHWRSLGIPSRRIGSYRASELAKLLSTSYYGWCIAFADFANDLCEEHGVDYGMVYEDWNSTYNVGYMTLDKCEVVRPILYPPEGKIEGHCIIENATLLDHKLIKKVIRGFK